mgnify:CR=1 FL=1
MENIFSLYLNICAPSYVNERFCDWLLVLNTLEPLNLSKFPRKRFDDHLTFTLEGAYTSIALVHT